MDGDFGFANNVIFNWRHRTVDGGDNRSAYNIINNYFPKAADQVIILSTDTEIDKDYYKTLEPPYEAKNGPIDDLAELLLIRGITPELYWGLSSTNHLPRAFQQRQGGFGPQQPLAYDVGLFDLFTPIAGGKLNINTASAAVLQLIPGIDSRIAEAIVAARNGEDDGSGLFGPYRNVTGRGGVNERVPEIAQIGPMVNMLNQFCDVRSRTFEVEVTAHVGGSERTYYATLVRNNLKDIQVLNFHWKW